MIELVLATAAVIVAGALIAALLPPRGSVAFIGTAALVAQASILAIVGIAGLLLRNLSPEVLTAIALIWLIAIGLVAWRSPAKRRNWPVRLRAAVAVAMATLRQPLPALATLLVVGALAWRVFLALRLPMVDYDGWSYHLVFGDVWLQHNALTLVPQRPWTAGFPGDSEVLSTWLMAFTRSDAFAGFTTILPLPLAITAVVGIARAFGADRPRALMAGLLFAMTPALVALAGTAYADISSIALAAATWWLGLRFVRGDRVPSTAVLLGLSGGLAIGSKGTNAPLVAPILAAAGLLVLWDILRSNGPGEGRRVSVANLAGLVLPVLAFGAIWYIKNWLAWGNPLYPFAVGPFAGPTTLVRFAVVVPELERLPRLGQLALSWTWDWRIGRYAYDLRPGGLGRAWPLIVLFAGLGLALLLRRRQWAAIGLVILPAGFTLATMPMSWYARETFFLPAIGLALTAVVLTSLRPRWATLASFVVLVLASFSLVLVNIRPNIGILSPNGQHLASTRQYLAYLVSSDATRADVSLRHDCAGFSQIPAGARVAPGGFNLLHGVVGPNLDRILLDPLQDASDPARLVQSMRAVGATWLVTSTGGEIDAVAASATGLLQDHGVICLTGHLWQLIGSP